MITRAMNNALREERDKETACKQVPPRQRRRSSSLPQPVSGASIENEVVDVDIITSNAIAASLGASLDAFGDTTPTVTNLPTLAETVEQVLCLSPVAKR